MTSTPIGLIGRGRIAGHLLHWFPQENLELIPWHRDMTMSPELRFTGCDTVILAVNDDAIAQVAKWPDLDGKRLIHLSGGRSVPGVPGYHPLMTFGPDLYDLETYRSIPFVYEEGAPDMEELFPGLPNVRRSLPSAKKSLYHALCVLSGNFTGLLWAKSFQAFEDQLHLPAEFLKPYLKQTAANIAVLGARAATGPLIRGDWETIQGHLEAMAGDPWRDVYQAFVHVYQKEIVS